MLARLSAGLQNPTTDACVSSSWPVNASDLVRLPDSHFQPFLHRRDFAACNRGVAAWYEDTEAQCYSDYLQK
jgi:hypothetical protein